jgi:Flp pilus assembly protein TadG
MKIKRTFQQLQRNHSGVTGVEFALISSLVFTLIVGVIDASMLMWTWNRAEKATQMGARFAAVTTIVAPGLNIDWTSTGAIGGQPVPVGSISPNPVICTSGSCSGYGYSAAAFNSIVARMVLISPNITAANVVVEYEHVGLGYAGDPNGLDVAPIITVRLRNLQYRPQLGVLFGGLIFTLPGFAASMPIEDGAGSVSN